VEEFKCEICGGNVQNKFNRYATTLVSPGTCANCDYERAAALEKDTRSVKVLRQAAALFEVLDDYSDAATRAKQCEDRLKAIKSKRWKRALLACLSVAVVAIAASLIVNNLQTIEYMLDYNSSSELLTLLLLTYYEDGNVRKAKFQYDPEALRTTFQAELDKHVEFISSL